jgi:hypothetical protein
MTTITTTSYQGFITGDIIVINPFTGKTRRYNFFDKIKDRFYRFFFTKMIVDVCTETTMTIRTLTFWERLKHVFS